MNRNAESRFSQTPIDIDIQRSRFDRSFGHKTTFNAGELIPIFCDEVLPGDTFEVQTNMVFRMSTPIYPVMDNAYLDTYFFFIPNRLVWDHWEAFNGQNDETYWTQPTEYNVPFLTPPTNGWDKGSLADYFGIPTNVGPSSGNFEVSALPFRAYVKVWNDWFRDQNTMNPAYFVRDDSTRQGLRRADFNTLDGGIESALYGGRPLQVSKFHDYFTSALPAPQKGPAVSVSANVAGGLLPVNTYPDLHPVTRDSSGFPVNVKYKYGHVDLDPEDYIAATVQRPFMVVGTGSEYLDGKFSTYSGESSPVFPANGWKSIAPANLYTDVNALGGVNLLVNDIRLAFQIQKLYEKDARGGTRYIEILKSHFGVESPDGRLQRSEYLGGKRIPINISQVLQTSGTDSSGDGTPLGSTAAYSLTSSSDDSFIKSFTEHGWIIGVACVRNLQTYQQGLNRMWSRKRRFDFYWPALANIGEQAILKKEVYCGEPEWSVTNGDHLNDAFGYQEAWAEYRYHPSIVTGAFRSNVNGSLDAWHYANDFSGPLSDFVIDETFLYQTPDSINRTLAVQSELEDQFIGDFFFNCYTTRPMPLYSVPGLIDHH